MTKRNIENKLRSAFENTVPDVLPSVLERCSEQEGRVITMTENKKRIPIVKIAVIAAAILVLLTGTVTAATFTGLIDKDEAFRMAASYVVENAESAGEKDLLTAYIYAGVAEIEMFEEQQVDLGLEDFRAIYNISFRLGEYAYKVSVDAKTGVILSCESEVDEDWWMNRQREDGNVRPIEYYGDYFDELEKFNEVIDHFDLNLIADGYTGLYTIPQGFYDSYGDCTALDCDRDSWRGIDVEKRRKDGFEIEDFPEDIYDKYSTWCYEIKHGGYRYFMYIDSVTGEMLDCEITELDEYEGVRHLHEPLEGYIGPYEARQIFSAETGHDTRTRDWFCFGVLLAPEGRDILTEGGVVTNDYGRDIYLVDLTMKYSAGGDTIIVAIDAKTGEVLDKYTLYKDPTMENQIPSTEAPDGMISEAVAAAIAFENSDVNEKCIRALKIDLKDGVYHVSYRFGYENFNATTDFGDFHTNTYEIDAVSGKILSFDAFTPDDYIGEEAALEIAYEIFGLSRENVSKDEVIFENNTRGYPQYTVRLYNPNGMDFDLPCELDAINGFNHSSILNR